MWHFRATTGRSDSWLLYSPLLPSLLFWKGKQKQIKTKTKTIRVSCRFAAIPQNVGICCHATMLVHEIGFLWKLSTVIHQMQVPSLACKNRSRFYRNVQYDLKKKKGNCFERVNSTAFEIYFFSAYLVKHFCSCKDDHQRSFYMAKMHTLL